MGRSGLVKVVLVVGGVTDRFTAGSVTFLQLGTISSSQPASSF